MALERKDVRFKLDASLHTLLVAVATDADQCDIGESYAAGGTGK